jgi:hypothetical protein
LIVVVRGPLVNRTVAWTVVVSVVIEEIVTIPVATLLVVVLLLNVLLVAKSLPSVETIEMGDVEGATVGPLHVVHPEEEARGKEVVVQG